VIKSGSSCYDYVVACTYYVLLYHFLQAPDDPSEDVGMNAPTSSDSVAVDPSLARLECEASTTAADKNEGFLQEDMNDLPTP
jgi:hypothetical protein